MAHGANERKRAMETKTGVICVSDKAVVVVDSSSSSSSSTNRSSVLRRPLTSQHRRAMDPAFRLGLPTWLGRKVWELYSFRAQTEWAIRLKTYNIIPHDSLIFQYSEDGNVTGLRDLVQQNPASVFDRDPAGRTALFVSTLYASIKR